MMLMGAFAANAQIADGSTAANIVGDRIISISYNPDVVTYGEEISLQAYLNEGKTVIVDMSAAWCAPCWGFHLDKTLEKLYTAYGPEGTDELRVIFIEADNNTSVFEMGAQGKQYAPTAGQPDRGPSQGDWITGVPYPIINNDTAAAAYGLQGFPSVYTIIPSGEQDVLGKVYNLQRGDIGDMVASINEKRALSVPPMPPMVGIENYGKIQAVDTRYCDAEGSITGYISSTLGHTISSAQVQLKKDGEILETKDFTVDIKGFATGAVDFTDYDLEAGADYQMVLTKVNGNDPLAEDTADFTSQEFNLFPSASVESGKNITATMHTDDYPEEIQFGIYNSAGTFVYISPVLTATAANRNKTFTYNVNPTGLLDPIDCYGVILVDGYGDGWIDGAGGPYGMTLKSGGTVLYTSDGDIGGSFQQDATFKTNGLLGNESFQTSSFAVYPNPSNGIFNFNTEETIDVTVVDITGKTVHTAKGIENGGSINLNGLQKGMYIAKISGASGERNEKLIIK